MAEAHQAVAFSFSITHEGVNVNFDREVLHLIWLSGKRSWTKRIRRFVNGVKSGIYPGSFKGLSACLITVCSLYYGGFDLSMGIIPILQRSFPRRGPYAQALSCIIVGTGIWSSVIFSARSLLKLLLTYKGWMYESRGKGKRPSWTTTCWLAAVKLLSGYRKPMLYSLQGSLPALPLPNLDETMTRYLRSIRPLKDDDEYKRIEEWGKEFQAGIGRKLQRYLYLKYWWATNYVSDWWEEYVYLRGRSSIMVNSNFYGLDAILINQTSIQSARAANITYSCLLFRRAIERQELQPVMVQGLVPLCSWQYERVFNTCRIPGEETDRIQHLDDAIHIVVLFKGCYYKMPVYNTSGMLGPAELQAQFEAILTSQAIPYNGESKLAALTAWDRTNWAKTRKEFFSKGVNKLSLDAIEKAAFLVILDENEFDFVKDDSQKTSFYARQMLHGNGHDRWFDKSFNVVVGKNGRIGFNAEHSWADAAVMSHLWEFVISEDVLKKGADAPIMGHLWEYSIVEERRLGYDEKGRCVGTVGTHFTLPMRLKWEIPADCIERIEYASQCALGILNDVDLQLMMFESFGKGFMKTCSVSPDAFIQMALQLAYYRDAGRFNLTYEASMTRLFKEGRTETVRPCTIESCAWVKSMDSQSTSSEEKIRLLRQACCQHQKGYQDAMVGKGVDRHLFCLYVISKYLEIDSPFLKEVLSEPWKLSTSQTPHGQTEKLNFSKNPECISAGGGFGPVADDGYGVSYIIAGEDVIFFHVSSKKTSPQTDSSRFSANIRKALLDIRDTFRLSRKSK